MFGNGLLLMIDRYKEICLLFLWKISNATTMMFWLANFVYCVNP